MKELVRRGVRWSKIHADHQALDHDAYGRKLRASLMEVSGEKFS
jgi:hypothetical protein